MSEFLETLKNSLCVHGVPIPTACEWCEREEAITLRAHDAGQISAARAIVLRLRRAIREEIEAAHENGTTEYDQRAILRAIEIINREFVDEKQRRST